ncbi:LacI family DNA-binding transcriptional regulator [Herbiconiux sp. L3-i23]|uniref:LacI family DNA-binding transcriptional regulator n=1 Tax=Herbiconiux sp. L3-i23 TaxID=2905871 RepID=UPI002053FCFB|nr:LacI family DNA-binding transcriptional regulator [Herbiconiux sp. L3-i23]BDI21452.1 LacI family transcriptional regulator [Herbiconiux sp. L3-i23]
MKSLVDVARLAGVSKATASRALNSTGYVSAATRERVAQAALQLGYVASTNAASLVTGRTRNVGVITPYINRWFFAEVIDGIEEALLAAGYDLTLYRLRGDLAQQRRVFDYFLVRKRVDAVIAVGMELESAQMHSLTSLRKPLVGVGGELAGTTTVRIDDVAAATMATRHLLRLGHTRLLHLGGTLAGELPFGVHGKRLHGFRTAMAEAGLPERRGDFVASRMTVEDGYDAAMHLLAAPDRPTAIVAASDEVAHSVILAARALDIAIPSQLSVVGVDDHPMSAVFGLTTVRQIPSEQGTLAVAIVLDLLGGAKTPEPLEIAIPLELIERTSTSPPTAGA